MSGVEPLGVTAGDIVESLRNVDAEDGPEAMLYIAWRAQVRQGDAPRNQEFLEWADTLAAADVGPLVLQVQNEMVPKADDPTEAS